MPRLRPRVGRPTCTQSPRPVPPSSLGPAPDKQGYCVKRVERNLYWATDGTYQATPSPFKGDVVRIGHEETRRLLLLDDDPARPPNEETF